MSDAGRGRRFGSRSLQAPYADAPKVAAAMTQAQRNQEPDSKLFMVASLWCCNRAPDQRACQRMLRGTRASHSLKGERRSTKVATHASGTLQLRSTCLLGR